jgi:hypothetical protein
MRGTPSTGTASPPSLSSLRRGGRRGVALAVAGLLGVGGLATLGTSLASAAVPTFPDNIVVFPERDFITVEGYQDHIGQTATVEVTRGGSVAGSAQGVVAEGDVAFEINHPGGVCWGAGTNLKVTPDIQAGDKATIKFAGIASGDTTVADAAVGPNHAELAANGTTVTVKGHIATGVNPAQLEQRIVNPDLTALVGRRDVRAVTGPLTTAPKGGYESGLSISGTTFTATYNFTDPRAAKIAAGTGIERLMSWQVEDADANRQGLTISEFGESGGPGFGGCPAGPADQPAPTGSFTTVRSADKSSVTIRWVAASPAPGAAAITGFDVEAIAPATAAGVSGTVGARLGATATSATLGVDPNVADYTYEVRSLTGARMSEPFGTTGAQTPPTDTTVPRLTLSPTPSATGTSVEASEVTLSSETGADLYYTDDGSSVLTGDLPSDSAKLYDPTKPIPVTGDAAKPTEIHAVAIDRAGNFTAADGFYKRPVTPVPGSLDAPTGLAGTPGTTTVALKWNSVAAATSYQVSVYNADGSTLLPAAQQPGETTNTTQTIAGLNGSTAYQFGVKAINAGGSSDVSTKVRVVTNEVLSITTARWKTGDFRVTGASSALSGTITVYRASADGKSSGVQIGTLTASLTPAVSPATGSTFSWRMRTGDSGLPGANPSTVFIKSTNGGTAGPFTVANG